MFGITKAQRFFIPFIVELYVINVVMGLSLNVTELNYDTNGAVYFPVYSSDSKSLISISIANLVVSDTSIEKLEIPFAVFRYTDIAFYDNFPLFDDYLAHYSESLEKRGELYSSLVDFSRNRFVTEQNDLKLGDVLGTPNIYSTFLTYNLRGNKVPNIDYLVEKSGVYCVYIAPPLDKGIQALSIPIHYKNSNGIVSVDKFRSFCYMKYSLYTGIILLLFTACYLFKLNRDEVDITIVPILRDIVTYNFAPLVFVQAIDVLVNSYENKLYSSSLISHLEGVKTYIIPTLNTIINYYFWLLFSMGCGIVYSMRVDGMNQRQLPTYLAWRARIHLIGDILLRCFFKIQVISPLGFLLFILWALHSIFYYFTTKKAIAKFPPFQDSGLSRVMTIKYKKSWFGIYSIPIMAWLLKMTVQFILYLAMLFYFNFKIQEIIKTERSISIGHSKFDEEYIFKLPKFQEIYLSEYIIIIFIFYVWLSDKHVVSKSSL